MKIKFFATYRAATGCRETTAPAPATVLALLQELSRRYPALREKILNSDGTGLGQDAIVLINGRNIVHLDGVATPLGETDTVALFPLVAGG